MNEDSGKARGILAVLLLLLLVAINIGMLWHPPADDFTKAQLNTLNGALLIQLGICMAFYFGSSSGAKTLSAAQTDHVQTLVAAAIAQPVVAGPTGTPADPVSVTETPAPPPPPAPEDPKLTAFRAHLKLIQPSATEDMVLAAWKQFTPVDVDLSKG